MSDMVKATLPGQLRITIVDGFKTITLPGDSLLTRHLAAACAADPESIEDLLLATEPLRPGITRQIVNALLEFDQSHHQNWMVKLDPTADIFEVMDARLEQISMQGLSGGLVLFDLCEKIIWTATLLLPQQGGDLRREDSLPVLEKGQLSPKTITYSLDKSWRIVNLAAAPELLAMAYRARPQARRTYAPQTA